MPWVIRKREGRWRDWFWQGQSWGSNLNTAQRFRIQRDARETLAQLARWQRGKRVEAMPINRAERQLKNSSGI